MEESNVNRVSEIHDQFQEPSIQTQNNLENFPEMERATQFGEDEDIVPEISSGDQIQLESYKSIPTFSGIRGSYRPWRNQVTRRMKMIDQFQKHPKYEAALGIIRAKIIGPASDVLTNNRTAYNIRAIIRTLDDSYADQRPMYVVELEMTTIKQLGKTLYEYYGAINQALNLLIHKIAFDYKGKLHHQDALVTEAQMKAVRTFIIGLRSQQIRHILYGRTPGTLAEAFAIAQTVYYDHQYLQMDVPQKQTKNLNMNNNKPNITQPTKPNYNKQNNSTPEKINENKQGNCRQQQQKINQIGSDERYASENMETMEEVQGVPDDLVSISSHTSGESSVFLEE